MLARGSWKWTYALPPAVLGAALFAISSLWGVVGFALSGFVLWFHRDPDRRPVGPGIVSPADGKVSVVRETEDGRVRLGVFMNVHNVHVNRAPLDGRVDAVEHEAGGHRPAFDKESEHNERVRFEFDEYSVVLIAGAFARRIHPYVAAGDEVARGDRIGHISFGSRADVVLPPEFGPADVAVERGEKVTAGETVLAHRDDGGRDPVARRVVDESGEDGEQSAGE